MAKAARYADQARRGPSARRSPSRRRVDGVRERTGEYDSSQGAPENRKGQPAPPESTRYLQTSEGSLSYTQVAERLAVDLARILYEIVEAPPTLAQKVYKGGAARLRDWIIEYDISKIKTQLGYRDLIAPAQALADAVDWLVANRPEPGGEIERQLGDPFAYAAEDAMLEAHKAGNAAANAVEFPEMQLGHMYRHPKKPGEVWAPPPRS